MPTIHSTVPPLGQGALFAQDGAGLIANTPTDGHGGFAASVTVPTTPWSQFTPGTFEVIIESVHIQGGAGTLFTEITGGGSFSIASSMEHLNIPMRDGFIWTSVGGVVVTFRISLYQR